MDSFLDLDPILRQRRAELPPEIWQARVDEALAKQAIIVAVEAKRAEGVPQNTALALVAPGLHRSTYRNRHDRYRKGGLVALVDHSPEVPKSVIMAFSASSFSIPLL
ncbi:MAG TPA: hypothetical protein V6C82_08490 [Chroococcales cyanobacterium]|jgi:hypothetical protein